MANFFYLLTTVVAQPRLFARSFLFPSLHSYGTFDLNEDLDTSTITKIQNLEYQRTHQSFTQEINRTSFISYRHSLHKEFAARVRASMFRPPPQLAPSLCPGRVRNRYALAHILSYRRNSKVRYKEESFSFTTRSYCVYLL